MTHNEKIVEAVARAICAEMGDDWEREGPGNVLLEAYGPLARAAITAYQAEAWRPIETAPKDGTHILIWMGLAFQRPEIVYWSWRLDCYVTPDEIGEIGKLVPTYWQPLPNPPASP